MNPSPNDLWSRLAAASQHLRATDARSTEAPFGFATRVVARWQDLQRSERFCFWGKWTLRASLAAAVVCLVSAISQPKAEAAPDPLGDLPTLTIPLP